MQKRCGFAALDPERRRQIASLGGKSVPAEKRAFSRDAQLAREAGRKGGQATPGEKRAFARDPEFARRAGRKGGRPIAAIMRAKRAAALDERTEDLFTHREDS